MIVLMKCMRITQKIKGKELSGNNLYNMAVSREVFLRFYVTILLIKGRYPIGYLPLAVRPTGACSIG